MTITGVDDAIEDGDVAYAIVTAPAKLPRRDHMGCFDRMFVMDSASKATIVVLVTLPSALN